eukprot:GDKJ01048492.1.p1 GENE.GDKJ01048492.1~~GDKJ01048492.1.p1  ORF type:complete len:658 (-),score=154.52 GDKJ01048492.1:54-2027(-)
MSGNTLQDALEQKEIGNKHFNNKELVEADVSYIAAFKIVQQLEKANEGKFTPEGVSLQSIVASNLSETALQSGRPYDAILAAKAAIQRDPHNPKSWFRLARAYGDLRFFSAASECCKEVSFLQRSKDVNDAYAYHQYCESRKTSKKTSPTGALTALMNASMKLESDIQREALMVALDSLNSNSLERPSVEFNAALKASGNIENSGLDSSDNDPFDFYPHAVIRGFAKNLVVGVCVPDLFNPVLKSVVNPKHRPWGLLAMAKDLFIDADFVVFVDALEALREAIDDPNADGDESCMPLFQDCPEALVRRLRGSGAVMGEIFEVMGGEVSLWEKEEERKNCGAGKGFWEEWKKPKTRLLCLTESLMPFVMKLHKESSENGKKISKRGWVDLIRLFDAGLLGAVFQLLRDCALREEKLGDPTSSVSYICFSQLLGAIGDIVKPSVPANPTKIQDFAKLYFECSSSFRAGNWTEAQSFRQYLTSELRLFSKLSTAAASHSSKLDVKAIVESGVEFEEFMMMLIVFFLNNAIQENLKRGWLGSDCCCRCDLCKYIIFLQPPLQSKVDFASHAPIHHHPQHDSCDMNHHILNNLESNEKIMLAVVACSQALIAERALLRGLGGGVLASCASLWGSRGLDALEGGAAVMLESTWVCADRAAASE